MARVEVTHDFSISEELTETGDYAVYYDEHNRITQVWIKLPNVGLSRIVAEASTEKCAKWKVTEDDEGRVTAKPSIRCTQDMADGESRHWHGFLTRGQLVPA